MFKDVQRRKIAVVGGGVIGLPCGVRLLQELPNVEVTLFSEEFSPDTTGDGSAGWIRPFLPGNTSQQLVYRWCKETSDHIQKLLHTPEAGQLGIYTLSGYDISREFVPEPYWKDLVFGFRKMTPEELNEFEGGYKFGYAYTSLMTECKRYLPWMMERFFSLGGICVKRKVNRLSELYEDYDIVVNCTGVGAYHLVGDKNVQPLKGQLIRVEAPWLKHWVNCEDDDLYVLVGTDTVAMGGTHEEGVWSKHIDQTHRQRIWTGCCRLVPSLQSAKIVQEWAGFRPGRTEIRLESEMFDLGNGRKIPVVHNYGHGGSGVTLHWGCAGDTVRLVKQLVQDGGASKNFKSKI